MVALLLILGFVLGVGMVIVGGAFIVTGLVSLAFYPLAFLPTSEIAGLLVPVVFYGLVIWAISL